VGEEAGCDRNGRLRVAVRMACGAAGPGATVAGRPVVHRLHVLSTISGTDARNCTSLRSEALTIEIVEARLRGWAPWLSVPAPFRSVGAHPA
jgi:hypothetical protein